MDYIYAGVHLMDIPYGADREYTYLVPESLHSLIQVGSFVLVPFGGGNKMKMALVTSLSDTTSLEKAKEVYQICSLQMTLSREFLDLCAYLKTNTLCTIGEAAHAMVPSSALAKIDEQYLPTVNPPDDSLSDMEKEVLELIRSKKKVTASAIRKDFGPLGLRACKKLCERGQAYCNLLLRDEQHLKTERRYHLSISSEVANRLLEGSAENGLKITSDAHKRIVQTLLNDSGWSSTELCHMCDVTPAQIKAVTDKGIIRYDEVIVTQDPYAHIEQNRAKQYSLNKEQSDAYTKIASMLDSNQPGAALLFGVTGSGKTSVMIKSIEHVLSIGKSAIVLLPEIALTPQSIAAFKQTFGETVAVLHSGLSAGEKLDAHARIRDGRVRIVIGTRSAIFAPVQNLGLIVIDEEQEHTYKSDQNPKYHARNVARFRCAANRAVMLLCSATPSLESYQKAQEGHYQLLTLTERYGQAQLPSVTVTDTQKDVEVGNVSPLGSTLVESLLKVYSKHEQSILFLNRRGYNHYVKCGFCGTVVTCPRCSVSMTFHTLPKNYQSGYLCCHWCGTKMPMPTTCDVCGHTHLLRFGYGTQRVEEDLNKLMPGVRVLRMDTDTVSGKTSYDRILGQFRNHEADILLGTQMVTKGHDFPDVTLVGVLNADSSLHLDDYRASEKTFSMLTQVIGRAGRAEKAGHAIIQTENPGNQTIQLACAQDYPTFFKNEILLRKALQFPPFCDILLWTINGEDEEHVVADAEKLGEAFTQAIKDNPHVPLLMFGPFEAPVFRVDNAYRMRIVMKCRWNLATRQLLEPIYAGYSKLLTGKSILSIDINPSSL